MRKLLALAGALFLFVGAVCAQFETAEVLGTVRDSSGGALPKAALILTNEETGIEMKSVADENGNYNFFNVKAGRYSLTAELAGFNKFTTSGVVVNVQARQRVDVELQVGAVTQSVEVKSAAAVLETDTSEHGQVINTQQIVELPLNGRNYSDLALLASNVHRSPLAAGLQGTPREGAFNANGMRSTYNNFLMDGLDNNAYSTSNQGFSNEVAQPSPDAIAEFKVITSNYSAEYGRVGGAVVNAAMRSGTNGFHGTAYDFLRNTQLNAIGYIFNQRSSTFLKPTLQRNQFGFTIGGPIIKNKLFFFADYEGFRQLQKALTFDSIPTMTDRSGTLPVAVTDPRTGAVYPANRPIPVTAITPFANQVLSALPAPNGTGRSNNYQALLLNKDYADKYDAKIDGQINNKMTAFVRFSQRKDNQYFQPDLPGPSGGNGNGYVRVLDQAAGAGYTWTITPESLFEARLGFTHILGGKFPPYLGGASAQALYGITGLPTSPDITGGLNTQSVSGFSAFGRQATNPQFQNPTTWDPKFNYSIVRGRHAIKTGFEFETIRTEVMDINPVYGLNNYSGQFSKPTCAQLGQASGCTVAADPSSYNLADFLFGLPSQVQLANYLITNYRQHQYFAYVQDDYRVNSKLTLNLGLRWEFATPRWERDNVLTNFDPVTNSLLKASNGSLYKRTLVNPDYKNFGPRLGMAYSPTSKIVVRGGYGISYVHLNRLGSADELGINGPQVNIATVNQSLVNGRVPPTFIGQGSFPPDFDSAAKFDPVNANIAYIPANTRWPYIQSWFLGVQHELPGNNLVEVAYNGNHGVRI
ncbi:MAG TPA: TonB-dependent receptor, partial [Bryobacteraceae bacterium]|nr:TonB-dependent receptor [Bryobacteraceae bacterium]